MRRNLYKSSISRRAVLVSAAVLLCVLAVALMLPVNSFANCLEPGKECDPEEWACESETGELITPEIVEEHRKDHDPGMSLNAEGELHIPVMAVVIGLNNISYDESYDWSSALFGEEDSLRDYYLDMSYGKLYFDPVEETSGFGGDNTNLHDAVNDGIIHVRVDRDHRDWGDKDQEDRAEMVRTFCDAFQQAAPYVDFSKYDDNGDGSLSNDELALVFIVAGYSAGAINNTFDSSLYLRSHRYTFHSVISKYKVKDYASPIVVQGEKTFTVDPYICAPEKVETKESDEVIVSQNRYAGIAHELGHHIGLPDLYDTSSATSLKRYWEDYSVLYTSLMASGAWVRNENGELRPSPLDPWSRQYLGWLSPEDISGQGTYTLTAQDYSKQSRGEMNKVYRINMPYTGEYYLLEARYCDKWDSTMLTRAYPNNRTMERKGGILIWHIDEKVLDECLDTNEDRYNDINNPEHRPAVMPLYPESDEAGKYTMIGSAGPKIYRPFFDKFIWDREYSDIGEGIDLPTYINADSTCAPSERLYSNGLVTILSDAGRSMDISYTPAEHTHVWERSYEAVKESDTHEEPAEPEEPITPEDPAAPEDICINGGKYYIVRKCTVPGCGETTYTETELEPGNHLSVRRVYNVKATCEKDGHRAYYMCTHCGRRYLDQEMTEEITDDSQIVIIGKHRWNKEVIREPTYYKTGLIKYTCRVCWQTYQDKIPKLDHTQKLADDGTACGIGAAIQMADKAIRGSSSEKDMESSVFRMLKLRSPKRGKRWIRLKWNKAADEKEEAAYYYVYAAKCGNNKFKRLERVYGASYTVKKIGTKKLDPKTYYKFIVVAVAGSTKEVMSTSKTIHVATKGTRERSNFSGIFVSSQKLEKAKNIQAGEELKLGAAAMKFRKTSVSVHRKMRYESNNKSIASVTSKGVIRARKPGIAWINAYTQNGKYKLIKVVVK